MLKVEPTKVALVLDFLHRGGELKVEGATYVWLNNMKVRETETHEYFIDGLARKLTSLDLETKKEEPYYIGCRDMELTYFFKVINDIPAMTYVEMLKKLKEMRAQNEN
ncbi:hypothetical protein BCP78_0115 [Bacillus phage BCP78]|uniref:Uncharacterized protein n=2 Tax=Tsarbombavirus BCP78 TaxID=1985182 RepID=J9PRB9_9CAUD|nr:hypothetical protein BCP78_0115 [Bacillus phage BCP78]YP_009783478.1 hypothetical protein QLX27_gp105 [Bacillus phage BCU4]AEW47122.1 hypothetical protein BCP78_0115 [Bacillus phage BCP78]AEW47611.1 hypothetical protein BCU4_0105 [Bacillus phage BCU4]